MSEQVVPALELRGVSFSYGDAPVLSGLSLSVPSGGVTGIVGPNGCGKSTLLKLADALLAPTSGEVRVAGRPVARLGSRERARLVALLPQVHRTPSMSVRKLVMCGRYAHMGVFGRPSAEDERAVDAALAEVGISRLAAKLARSLSGGERQRAFLAMAVAQDAGLLLLDEPTTYLDVRAAQETMALTRKLAERPGRTVVAVVHDLDLALRFCDRIVVMGGGGVSACGEPGDERVLAAIESAFRVRVLPVGTELGRAYTFFSR
ncbi:ATP-binding cassette domain-containing protein [uncultured Parolsenella sp.]|uniref:ABC transporter ATP-binding protein n=1 Tax=uncultured Parolsenella sp. TaxID=2083008 RepID=UPI0027D9BE73|nr:ATP-binding cassette domain-containing protein [uncultured Parolsenella sp.]